MKKIFVYLIALLLLIGGPALMFVGVAASGIAPEDIVTTEEELTLWCEEHDGIGGTVYLGADITIEYGISGGYNGGFIVIDTGKYGITYDGGVIFLTYFEIIGEGVDTPVVTVKDIGYMRFGNWNNILIATDITATGRDGQGGVALRLASGIEDRGALFSINMVSNEYKYIKSFGEGAVGILADIPLELYCFSVEVSGTGATAISAPNGTVMYYSRLSASGAAASLTYNSGTTLDTCIASPTSLGATMINRRISDVSGRRFYLPIPQGSPWDWMWLTSYYTFWLSGDDGSEVKIDFLLVEWDEDAILAIDTDEPGFYTVQGQLPYVYNGFGLTDEFPLSLTIEVRDPAIPCIGAVTIIDYGDEYMAVLDLWNEYDPAEGGFILWRSDDEGQTWYDFTDSPALEWPTFSKNVVQFHYDDITNSIMFCLEVPGIGESNVLTLYEKDGISYGNQGGDRTGTDRPGGGEDGYGNGNGESGNNNNNGYGSGNLDESGSYYGGSAGYENNDSGNTGNDFSNNQSDNENDGVKNDSVNIDSDSGSENDNLAGYADTTDDSEHYVSTDTDMAADIANGFAANNPAAMSSIEENSNDISALPEGVMDSDVGISGSSEETYVSMIQPPLPLDSYDRSPTDKAFSREIRDNTADATDVIDSPDPILQVPPPEPFIPVNNSLVIILTVAGAAALTCLGALAWFGFRRFMGH